MTSEKQSSGRPGVLARRRLADLEQTVARLSGAVAVLARRLDETGGFSLAAGKDRLVCLKDAARRMCVSRRAIFRLLKAGTFPAPAFRQKGRRTLWRESDLDRYIAELPTLATGH